MMAVSRTKSTFCTSFFASLAFLLLAQVAAAQEPAAPTHGKSGLMVHALHAANYRLGRLTTALENAPAEFANVWQTLSAASATTDGIVTLTYWLIVMLIGCGMEWFYWTYAASSLRVIDETAITSAAQAFRLAARRFLLLATGLVLFILAISGSLTFFEWPAGYETAVFTSLLLIFSLRVAWLLADTLLAPGRARFRFLDIDPRSAGLWVATVVLVALLLAMSGIVGPVLEQMDAPDAAETLHILTAALGSLAVLATVLRHQHAIARHDQHKPPKFPVEILMPVMIAAVFGLWLVAGPLASMLLASLFIVSIIQWHLKSVVFFFWSERDFTSSQDGLTLAEEAGALGHRLAPSIALSVARYSVCVLGIATVLLAVGIPFSEVENSQNPAARFVLHLLGVTGIALVTHVAWVAVRVPIDQRLRELGPSDTHGRPNPNARLMTLLPMLRMAAGVTFAMLLILSVLWTFGVDVTPLLAGAGVFGLALGFGSQALVRDLISGIFYLAEDVFRVGEYIESGSNIRGTVERITLRTVALRHQNGPLHFVPYGSLGSVRNNSRDWSIDKFNIPLPVYVESEAVRKLVKKVGESMQEDPELGALMLEPLKAKLYRIDPGVKIFRCKFRSAPGNQFEIRTEAYRRIEKALKEAGIPFAAGTQVLVNDMLTSPPSGAVMVAPSATGAAAGAES
ncbi:mechanosensitive ion channel family protein [Rhizobium paknamense]|uniref:Small-conductance mechanosensitive channel n=1 Tax=Rhizobium paknamense TaxID=1206817 RepID=A0ABU0IIY4_9HYPH|nr:mechanosensitive ion channel family protein [Rhizobium paknamense]MDQ0458223.1 small-conductance mechanosensitive channel [Rhizobium paknamense]